MMNPTFNQGIWGDPVRVKVAFSHKVDGHAVPEYKQFSLDPELTNLETLHSLLSRAFDIKSDFLIQYRLEDSSGRENIIQLNSDLDLKAAFHRAAHPFLCLRIDPIPIEHVEEWDLVGCPVEETKDIHSAARQIRISNLSMHTKFLSKVEKTINLVQQALNLSGYNNGDLHAAELSSETPLTDTEFTRYRDKVGTLIQVNKCKRRIFEGGLEPSLRRVLWKHLLNVYPEGLTGHERLTYMGRKSEEYQWLKSKWMLHYTSKNVSEELRAITSMVRKDVLRTDRQHPYYSGTDDNPNIEHLFNILTTYAIMHPTTSYCQGMSDLASPILYVMGNESHSYIAFTALMERLKENFSANGCTMTTKFEHLSSVLAYYDPAFFAYLQRHNAGDLLFCYRWLLLEMKREFAFDDALRMIEVTWSSLPPGARQKDLSLFEKIPDWIQVTSAPILVQRPWESCAGDLIDSTLRKENFTTFASSSKNYKHYQNGFVLPSFTDPIFVVDSCLIDKVSSQERGTLNDYEALVRHPEKDLEDGKSEDKSANASDSEDIVDTAILPSPRGIASDCSADISPSDAFYNEAESSEKTTAEFSEGSLNVQEEDDLLYSYDVIACEEGNKVEPNMLTTSISNVPIVTSKTDEFLTWEIDPVLPSPVLLGCGNPFLIFLCLTLLLQHRDYIMNRALDSNEIAMHFDRLVRKHDVQRVLCQSRALYNKYLNMFSNHVTNPNL